jgi:heme exporter protein C
LHLNTYFARLLAIGLLTFFLLTIGLYEAIFSATPGIALGDAHRILYYEMPLFVVAVVCFLMNFAASICYLRSQIRSADAVALATAEVGLLFCLTSLITNILLVRAELRVWWVPDAHLMMTAILCLLYASYLMLRFFANIGQGFVISAVLAIFIFIDIPITYASLHLAGAKRIANIVPFPSHLSSGALAWNTAGFAAFGVMLFYLRYRLAVIRARVEELQAERECKRNTMQHPPKR